MAGGIIAFICCKVQWGIFPRRLWYNTRQMKILTRYVLKEFLVPLFYCLAGFLSIYVLFDLFGSFSRLMSAKITFAETVSYFCGYLAPYVHYIVPAALMLATLYTMWSFCRHSEIIAMRASGVSFVAIVKPLLAVALLAGVAVAWVNEVYVPANAHWAAQMKSNMFDQSMFDRGDNVVYRNSSACRTWNIDKVKDRGAKQLENVRVTVDRPDGGARLYNVSAKSAMYLDGEWWFSGAKVQHFDASGREMASPTPEVDALEFRCFPGFDETPADFLAQNRPWRFNSVRDRFRFIATHPEMEARTKEDCLYDTWAQIMAPWACVIITLFAIPAGIASGRQSVFKGILGALAMYFSFYGLTIACMVLAKNGWCPPILGAVLPGVVFLVLGMRSFMKQR